MLQLHVAYQVLPALLLLLLLLKAFKQPLCLLQKRCFNSSKEALAGDTQLCCCSSYSCQVFPLPPARPPPTQEQTGRVQFWAHIDS
jgi:hypothetical protein